MNKILIVGDTHGYQGRRNRPVEKSYSHIYLACKKAQERGIDKVFQVGDFGYWTQEYIDHVQAAAKETNTTVYWLKGNHENHSMILDLIGSTERGLHVCAPNVIFCDTNSIIDFDGTKVGVLSGGFSIDKQYRTPMFDWFPEETMTENEIHWAETNMKADVIFSHDSPDLDINLICGPSKMNISFDLEAQSLDHRKKVQRVVNAVKPKMFIHGHYHHHYITQQNQTTIIGLANDGRTKSSMILDLGTMEFEIIKGEP